jgi:hypothetical protein
MMLMRQRTDGHCGVAALAMFAELPDQYVERVILKMIEPARSIERDGLLNRHIVTASAKLGIALTPTKRYDLDLDEGVLRVRFTDGYAPGHFVAVRSGLILCPTDGVGMAWDEYLERWGARPCTLMRGMA